MTKRALPQPDFAQRIKAAWQKSLEGIFECGDLLLEAKAKLAHGQFIPMIERELPFERRVAEMLMKVAGDKRLRNAQTSALLPPSWCALYELSRLPSQAFKDAINQSAVYPEMTVNDCRRLVDYHARREQREAASRERERQAEVEAAETTGKVARFSAPTSQATQKPPDPLVAALEQRSRKTIEALENMSEDEKREHDAAATVVSALLRVRETTVLELHAHVIARGNVATIREAIEELQTLYERLGDSAEVVALDGKHDKPSFRVIENPPPNVS